MKNFSKNIFVWVIISLILLGLFNIFKNSQRDYSSLTYTYSTLLDKAENGEIKSVEIQGNNIYGQTMDGMNFSTYAPRDPNLIETLSQNNVSINAKPEQTGMHPLLSIFVSWFPMLLLNWCLDIFYASNAIWKRRWSPWFWSIKSKTF